MSVIEVMDKVENGQIWEKNYSPDSHYYLPVRIKILSVDSEKIVSEVIYSSISSRPVGSVLTAYLEGADPYEYKKNFGWALDPQDPLSKALLKINQYDIN